MRGAEYNVRGDTIRLGIWLTHAGERPPNNDSRTMHFPTLPEEFEGLISSFVDEYVVPAFPPADSLHSWTEALLAYYNRPDPVCIVRGPRKGELRWEGGLRVVDSDNAPGIWCYLRAGDRTFPPEGVGGAIEQGELAVLMALKSDLRPSWTHGREMTRADKQALWTRHLKHCHILPVKAGTTGLTLRQRALRNLCPVNHFVFPTPRRYRMWRLGWSEPGAVGDLGESETVIRWVQRRLQTYLDSGGRHAYPQFLQAAGGAPSHATLPRDERIHLVKLHASPATAGAATPRVARGETPPGHGGRRWTLAERRGYVFQTRIPAPAIELCLWFGPTNGQPEYVGRYHLDLDDLSLRGVVTRRFVDGRWLFDVKVCRDSAGTYWIQVREHPRLPLADFAV